MSATSSDATIEALGKIYDKLVEVAATVAPLPAQAADHEQRIRSLERVRWKTAGFYLAGSAVIGVLEALYYTNHLNV